MRQSDPRPWLHDILDAIVAVRAAVGSMSLEAYGASWTTRRASERAIEIISEASRRLPSRCARPSPMCRAGRSPASAMSSGTPIIASTTR
jgi:uncharacterized protein with HEPN domain